MEFKFEVVVLGDEYSHDFARIVESFRNGMDNKLDSESTESTMMVRFKGALLRCW